MFRNIVNKILKESKLLSSANNNRKIYTTTRLEDIFTYCKNTFKEVRAYYDIRKKFYVYSLAYDYIHFDIAQEAFFQGLYPEYEQDRYDLQRLHTIKDIIFDIIQGQCFCFVVVPYHNEEDIKDYDDFWQGDRYTLSKTIASAGVKIYWRTNEESGDSHSERWAEKLFGKLEHKKKLKYKKPPIL